MEDFNTPQLKLAFEFVQFTGQNIFLTGKAGTGKTTFLHNLKKHTSKRLIVVAPTGVAAINAKGVTMHSFFQMPFSPYIPRDYTEGSQTQQVESRNLVEGHWKLSKDKINIIRGLDLLIIDEISMVRSDILDQIDAVLRRYKNRSKVFGGVQLLMIGDIQQLAPVIKDDEWNILRNYYESVFFFSSKALKKVGFTSIELKHIFRQQDDRFIGVLNKIRENKMDNEGYKILGERYIPDFDPEQEEGYITLTTHNAQAKSTNESKLQRLDGKEYKFKANIDGTFPEYSYPTDVELVLKVGAQVMFVKNDISPEKRFFNGKIGTVERIEDYLIYVKCKDDEEEILVDRAEWQNMKYSVNNDTKEINEDVIGTFVQYPLKLAWAITIHKSQGLTFDRAIIDANAAFAHGQVYVALSRCRTLEGLVLSSPLSAKGIISNPKVASFSNNVENNQPGNAELTNAKQSFELELLLDLFDFVPIVRKLFSGKKIIKGQLGVNTASVIEKLDRMIDSYKPEVVQVAEKFEGQIKHLFGQNRDIVNNQQLQERVTKGCAYFIEKFQSIFKENLHLETDNKAAKKMLKKFNGELDGLTNLKLACLENSKEGFDPSDYMETRAKEAIQPEKAKVKKVAIEVPEEIEHPELYQQLKSWRDKTAQQTEKQVFMVLQVKSMHEISNLLPMTSEHLLAINGFGKKKVEQHGKEVLDIVTAYAEKHNLSSKLDDPRAYKIISTKKEKTAPKEKKEKIPTQTITLKLFKEGKNADEIAAEREMSPRTVEGHLAKLVEEGEIKIDELLEAEKIDNIATFFLNADDLRLSPAKEALGDDYSWADLKYVLSHLRYEKKVEIEN